MMDETSWKEKALKAMKILETLSQPPLQLATVVGVDEKTVEIGMPSGAQYIVHYDPRLKGKLKLGQDVRISPESYAVVSIEGKVRTHSAAVVEDVLKDGRVKISSPKGEKVIQTAVEVKAGENVIVDNSFSVVLENLGNSSKAYSIEKVPKVPWKSIGGLEQTICKIKETVEQPFLYKEVYSKFPTRQPPKGVLIFGPPGCGKTMIGKAIAYNLAVRMREKENKDVNGYFLYVAGPEFLQRFVGVGEAKVRELFGNARETAAQNGDPVVIFVDEPEAVLRQRGTGKSSDAHDSIVNQFLVEMDGLNSLENVMVLLATNRHELLDSAVVRPGRIDKKIYVPRPDQQGAESIFSIYLKDLPLHRKGFNSKPVKQYAQHAASQVFEKPRPVLEVKYMDGNSDTIHYKSMFSGASVVSIVNRAIDFAINRGIKGKSSEIVLDDLTDAVEMEYEENRALHNQFTPNDMRDVVGDNFKQIVEVTAAYR